MNAIFLHDYPLVVEPGSTPRPVVQKKKSWTDSLPIDMLLSAVSVLVVAQSSSEIPLGLMNNPVYTAAAAADGGGPCIYPRRLLHEVKFLQQFASCFNLFLCVPCC